MKDKKKEETGELRAWLVNSNDGKEYLYFEKWEKEGYTLEIYNRGAAHKTKEWYAIKAPDDGNSEDSLLFAIYALLQNQKEATKI